MAYIYKAGSQALADLQKQQELQRQTILNANKQQNNGGFIGGVGYIGEKIGLGALSWAEGMTDFIGSSFAKWFGNEEAAKRILANDWVNYNDADEWYNPGKGMQLVGDVASGIGYSLPSMAIIAGVTLLTAGTGTGAVAAAETASAATKGAKVASVLSKIVNPETITTFTTSFLPAAGNAAKEAYRQTGDIGGKEYRYALASGALEGGVEAFSDMVFGAGIGGIGKMLGKSLAGKAGMESLGKTVAKSFLSEGAEELVSGIFEPMIKRATYDPNAQNATAGELAYQALVGGLSGAIMGGTTKVGIDARNAVRGANIVKEGKANSILNSANAIVEGYRKQGLQLETVDNLEGALKQLNDSVAKTGGNIETVTQKNLLGYIENATFAAYSDPIVMRAARDVVISAPSLADAFNKYYTVNGQKADFKAEDITAGIDFTSAETINRTLPKAVRNNEVLRNIVAYEASGRLMMDTDKYVNTYLRGKAEMNDATQRQLNTFIEQATDAQKQSFANALGIADLNTATAADVINGFAEYEASGKAQAQLDLDAKVESLVKDAKVKETLPTNIGMQRAEAVRYKNDLYDIGVVKNGAEYVLYNYGTGEKTYALSRAQAQNQLTSIKNQETQSRDAQAASEIDTYARNNVEGYATLTEPNKQAIRMTIRQARANNIADEEVKTYAQFAARTGINVEFDARELATQKGTADAAALTNRNVIYVNPSDGKARTYDKILVHELEHFLAKEENGQKLIDEAVKKISQDDFRKIARDYTNLYEKMGLRDMDIISSIVQDEASAKYAETITNPQVLSYILAKEPTFAEKVVGLFTRTANAYSFNKEMSKEARRFMRTYKKAFDAFAARNEGLNALTLGGETARIGKAEEKSVKNANDENVKDADRKEEMFALQKDKEGNLFVEVDSERFGKKDDPKTIVKVLKQIVKEKFNDFVRVNGQVIGINQRTANEWVNSKSAKSLMKYSNQAFIDKMNAFEKADALLQVSRDYVGEAIKHERSDNFKEFSRGVVSFKTGDRGYDADVIVGTTKTGVAILYDVINIRQKEKVADASYTTQSRRSNASATDNSIPDSSEKVNTSGENSSENSSGGKMYALPLSVDQAKAMANMTEGMVYTKKDAESAINSILEDRFVYDDETFAVTGKLSGKSKNEIVEYLAKKLNTAPEGRRGDAALKIADYLLDHVVMEEVFNATDAEDTDTERARNIVNVMKYYKHNIDFGAIKSDVVHALDKKGAGVAFMQFSSGENEGVSADYLKASFAEIGANIETDVESEIFLEAYDMYRKARETLNTKARKEAANLFFNTKERQEKRQQIAKDILNAYQRSGTQSKVSKVIDQYQKQIKSLRSSLEDAKFRNRLENDVSFSAQRLKEIADKHGKISASDTVFPELTAWIKKAAGVNFRGQIRKNVEAVRDVFIGVDGLATFYNENNVLLTGGGEETAVSYLDENVIDALDFIKERYEAKEKILSRDELHAMNVVLRGMEKLYRTYDKVILNGKQVSLTETAKKGIEIVKKTKNTNTNKILKGVANNYVKSVVEPRVVIESLEHFDPNGVLTQAFNDITDAETNARWIEMDLMRYIEGFVSKNGYKKHLTNAYVKLNGKDFLTFNQAIDLYLVSKREQAQEGLYEAGIEYTDKDGRTQHRKITKLDIDEIYSQFNEDDKTFIAYLEKFYNVDASKIKFDADNRILGYTNIQDGYYYPIIRAGTTIARSLTNVKDLTKEMRDIYSYSFNKNLRKGAKNELHITDAYSKAQNHAHLLSVYSELTIPLQSFDMLYNKNVGTSTDVQSIRKTVTDDVWNGANSYLRNLMQDIQGSRTTESGWFNRIFSKIRSAGAVASLGANPKVVLSQTSSFPAALTELDIKSLMVSPVVTREDFAEMDKYCRAAAVRNYSQETVKAESVSDKISKPGEVLMKPISWSDRYTIGLLWKASQNQAQADGFGEVGTVENKKAAGKILERVIRKTQPNYTAAERSAWMRDTSTMGEITKGFTMFTSAPLKLLSRFVESSGRLKYALETKTGVKEARKQFNKTLAALLSSMAMYSMIAQFFKWLYRKDRDDDKTFMQDYLSDVALNTIGIFPLVKDIYSLFNDGYEISNFTFDIVNDVLKNVSSVAKLTEKAIDGEAIENWEIGAAMRKVVYSAGQLAGFPTRNINNVFSGLLRRFDPSTAYKYDSMFYNAQYGKDFANAVKDGDEKLASTILSLLMQENAGSNNVSKNALAEMQKLYESGYSVLPKRVPTSYSVTKTDKSGAEVETTEKLTKKQKKAFNAIYAEADAAVDNVIASRYYASLDDEGKARAIKSVYDAYYAKAKQEALGLETPNSVLSWSKYIGMEKAATIIPRLSRIEGDKDRKGNTISGSKRKNMEKYLRKAGISAREQSFILSMIGYSMDSNGKRKTLQYILSLDISKDEKAEIAEKCGFQVRNGRIIRNF